MMTEHFLHEQLTIAFDYGVTKPETPHSALGYLTPAEFEKKLVLTLRIFGLNKR